MGLGNSTHSSKNYLNVVAGKFAIKAKEGAEGAVKRTNKNNQEVWEHLYNELSGVLITGIEKKVQEGFGASWQVTLKEGMDDYILNLPFSSRVTNGLMFRLPNIDLSSPMSLRLFTFKAEAPTDKDKTFMTVEQNGKKVDPAYTKDSPNGLPEMKKVKIKGIDTWDDSDQLEFIETMVNTTIIPQLSASSQMDYPDPSLEDDQLPF